MGIFCIAVALPARFISQIQLSLRYARTNEIQLLYRGNYSVINFIFSSEELQYVWLRDALLQNSLKPH
jgi:hypothetical protein